MNTEFYWVAVALVTIVSVSRLTRLATWDEFPPAKWARDKYADLTDGSGWQLLAFCGYCASFWIATIVIGTGYAAGVYGDGAEQPPNFWGYLTWWLVNGTLAVSYVAAILMVHDGDDGDED